ncbi:MAG: VOC family protein [Nitriliruptorales bacterium]|nr:VOC family protein [Nitriliruptorales bacterium]
MPLAAGCNHVAMHTQDLDRLIAFYTEVFDAEVTLDMQEGPLRHALIDLGGGFCLHPFENAEGSDHAAGSDAMFDRGHLDHVAIDVSDVETFELLRDRLVAAGASDGTVTDFGAVRCVWFEDPDGMGSEIAIWSDGEPLDFDARRNEAYEPARA